jgi:brefeldin A-inhibited guanine nucleotide-exchange protein
MSYTNVNSGIVGGGVRPADMFLTRALEKMLSDKEMKKSQSAQLKKQCETTLNELKSDAKNKPTKEFIQINDSEKYFLPFELACKSKSSKIVETALDCIQVSVPD